MKKRNKSKVMFQNQRYLQLLTISQVRTFHTKTGYLQLSMKLEHKGESWPLINILLFFNKIRDSFKRMFPVDTTILPSIKSTGGEAQVNYSSSSKIDNVFGKLRNLQAPKTTALSPSFPVYLNQICPFWKLRNLQGVPLFVSPRICVLH